MRLKHTLLTLLVTLLIAPISAQIRWSNPKVNHIEDDRYQITTSAAIDEGWHIYDLVVREGGPNATQLNYESNNQVELIGKTTTSRPAKLIYDDIFEMEIGYLADSVTFNQEVRLLTPKATIKLTAEWMLCNDTTCTPPDEQEFSIEIVGEPAQAKNAQKKSDLWIVIIEAILWGFAALLTPCVFPMVPMTVSFFLKGDQRRGRFSAMLYGAFIVALYTLPIAAIILITRVVGGETITTDIFNWVATHWLPNIIFFIIFILFAASFFGAFEISLPSKWINASDSRADKSSVGGVLFLALTLVLVSFSCTGPIVGSVLIKSTAGEFWEPIITMLAFSSAFALPFMLIALAPSLIQRLPKSGGWLSSVKIVLGFIELALALKFLSVADQTYRWGILSRELYIAIWMVIFTMLGLYLLGAIKFSSDSRIGKIGIARLASAIATLSFVIYLGSGLNGNPLAPLAGYLPPPTTKAATEDKKAPNGLDGFYNLAEAETYANEVGKPLLVDLTGYGCVNCREMEQRVWSDPEIDAMLRDDYVIAYIYMDDKTRLPESEWVTTQSGRVLKSIGQVNSQMALARFGVNAQPYYIILGRDGEELVAPRGYDLNIEEYAKFLRNGIETYNATRATPPMFAPVEPILLTK